MSRAADITVIGAGAIGLALAWRLAVRGADVRVIDAGAELPAAARAAAGMLAPSFERTDHGPAAMGEALYRFSAQSLEVWRHFAPALCEASGADLDYRAEGMLGAALDETGLTQLREDFEALKARGGNVAWLDGDEMRAAEPALSAEILGGYLARQDGQVDPVLMLAALKTAFIAAGGAYHTGHVRSIDAADGAIIGVGLADGTQFSCERVVIATGAAPGFIERAPPIHPVKGEAVSLETPQAVLSRVVRGPGAYLCPKADGRLIIGATEAPGETSRTPSDQAIATLKENAARLAPTLAGHDERARWAGLRPGTPDGAPILGAAPCGPEGLFYAQGHYRNGILLAPASAEAMAALLLDGAAPEWLTTFSPGRFSATAL